MTDLTINEVLEHLDKLMDQCKHHPDMITKIGYFELECLKNYLLEGRV